jgi:outer membrane receptor protein involved in Fe transport
MLKRHNQRLFVRMALATSAILLAGSGARAQNAEPSPSSAITKGATQGGQLEQITVTGSLIPTAESEGALPVTTYDNNKLKSFGAVNAIEGLRSLPSFFGQSATENTSNGGDGSATVDLRGLGSAYTLTLLDGFRLATSDLNLFPLNFIETIDILKDGATSRYGADAVAGVVNIKLRHSLPEGTFGEINLLYGAPQRAGGDVINTTFLSGFSTDKFSIIAGYDYYSRNTIYSRDRPISSNANATGMGGVDKRSETYPGVITYGGNDYALNNSAGVPTSLNDYHLFGTQSSDGYNFLAQTPSIPGMIRNSAYGALDYKIFDKTLEFFAEFLHTSSRTYNSLASSPYATFGLDDASFVALQASPFNPAPDTITQARYRSLALGPRTSVYDKTANFVQAGFRGEIPSFDEKIYSPISWEVGYAHEDNREEEFDGGDFSQSRFNARVANGLINPFVGINAPQQGTVVINGVAHSYNNAKGLKQAAVNEVSNYIVNLQIIDFNLHTTLFPDLYQGGITIAGGAEYRWQQEANNYSPIFSSHDTAGFEAAGSWSGERSAAALFGEALIPIVTPDNKIPGIYSLDVDAALRYERTLNGGIDQNPALSRPYAINSFHSTDPRIAIRYQPFQDLTFRASYSTSFRAPSLSQLFSAASLSAVEIFNPKTNKQQQLDYGAIQGSNDQLKPEIARNWELGAVYSPHWVPGAMTFSIDWYYIHQANLIAQNDPNFILSSYFANGNYGNLITVEPTGRIYSVNASNFNVGGRDVEGLDMNFVYKTPDLPFGSLTLTVALNYTMKYQVNPGQGQQTLYLLNHFVDPQGGATFAPGTIPYWKGFVDLAYDVHGFELGSKVNYASNVLDDSDYTTNGGKRWMAQATTWDIRASYTFKKPEKVKVNYTTASYSKDGKEKAAVAPVETYAKPSLQSELLDGTTIRVGINNLLDQQPPFVAGAFNDNYDTMSFSNIGRFYYVSLTKQF